MQLTTPFHSRTSALCKSYEWRHWSHYVSPAMYEHSHEREYYAIRNSAALIDVSPLFKYEISGPDATRLVNRIIPRNAEKCAVGQIFYTPWCDDAGKILDDGTVSRLGENHWRITSADPNLRWFQDCGYQMNVQIEDVTMMLAALSLQGPLSRAVLQELTPKDAEIEKLKFFRLIETQIEKTPVTISRTGYTGDLGYEIWTKAEDAENLWDAIFKCGRKYGLLPTGLVAMDIARIEAGLLLIDVDYIPARKALIESQKSSPFEAGLGWTVKLDKGDFVGKRALVKEKDEGSFWAFVGLEANWEQLESLHDEFDLPPSVAGRASRLAVPVYSGQKQVGQATSSAFSPILKKFIALATIESKYAKPGVKLELEFTVNYMRKRVSMALAKTPFFDPPRKRK